jgi:hypothetical protein
MKIIEKVFLCTFVSAFLLKLLNIAGASTLFAVCGMSLQISYLLGSWYLFAITKMLREQKKLSNGLYTNISVTCLLIAFLFMILGISNFYMLFGIFGVTFQIIYLISTSYLFDISEIPTKPEYNNILFSIISGICLSASVYVIVAITLHWRTNEITIPIIITTILGIFPFAIYKWLNKNTENKTYYNLIIMRGLLFTILSILAYFI